MDIAVPKRRSSRICMFRDKEKSNFEELLEQCDMNLRWILCLQGIEWATWRFGISKLFNPCNLSMNYSSDVIPRSFLLCHRVEALQTRYTVDIYPLVFFAQKFPFCGRSYDKTRLYLLSQCFEYIITNDKSLLTAVKTVTRVIYAIVAERIQRKLLQKMGPTKLTDSRKQNRISFR